MLKKLSILSLFTCVVNSAAQGQDSKSVTLFSFDYPVYQKQDRQFSQRLYYQFPQDSLVDISIDCYYYPSYDDSTHVYELLFEHVRLSSGAHFRDLHLSKAANAQQTNADFFEVLRRLKTLPVGKYKTALRYRKAGDKEALWYIAPVFEQSIDSTLSQSSGLREKANSIWDAPKAAYNKRAKGRKIAEETKARQIQSGRHRLQRQLKPIKGLEWVNMPGPDGKQYSGAYYKGFFLGRYELSPIQEMGDKVAAEKEKVQSNAGAFVTNELTDYQSVGTQLRALYANRPKDNKLKGVLDLNTFRATAQDPQSQIDQNYTELMGNVNVELFGFPVNIEGFYTTQDAHRQAKASYIRFHYDIESAKAQLQEQIATYKRKMNETISKGKGLDAVYSGQVSGLERQKEALLRKMAKDYALDPEELARNNGDVEGMLDKESDSAQLAALGKSKLQDNEKAQKLQERRERILQHKQEIEEQYRKIEALAVQAQKYVKLLDQYKNQNYLDSAINYQKISDLEQKDAAGYRDMTKAAAGFLPEGKVKNFVTGLTNLDIGIINKYESDYTLSGQTMKGLSLGYDLGPVKTGVSMGSTEYVSRTGSLDRYSSLLLRVDNKGAKGHQIGFLYNMNTPARSMSVDDNFIGQQSVRYPSFNSPSHIASLVYNGEISKHIRIHTEWAQSFKKGQQNGIDMDHAALNNDLNLHIPKTSINVTGAWEHLGASFENNTLPYIRSGTDRYTLGTMLDLFRSFLSLKVDYNYMVQQNLSSTGYNTKWGFDVRTHSKRYPSVQFSYKPFSTFRSLSDTFQVAQRPIQGEVWMGRASYQIKRQKQVHRFTLMYNKNTSTNADTIAYASSTMQAAYIYTAPALSLNASISRIELPADFADGSGIISSYVAMAGVGKPIGKYVQVNISGDVAYCDWGLQRVSSTLSLMYHMKKIPLSYRMMLRGSQYRLKSGEPQQQLYAGQMGLNWQFQYQKQKRSDIK